jgi:hypothetical protein
LDWQRNSLLGAGPPLKGDHPSDPIELIIRRIGEGDTCREETVLRIGHRDYPMDREQLEALLNQAVGRITSTGADEGQ